MKLGICLNDCVDRNTYRNKLKSLSFSEVRRRRERGGQWKGRRRIAVSYTHLDVYKRQM